jgi:hypothetical protein
MTDALKWPDEFADPTPVTNFGHALTELLQELVQSACEVTADQHWSWFSVSHQGRIIDFVRRGRLGDNRDYCWEVRLSSDGQPVQLGGIFGIRDYACVVIAGLDSLRNVTKAWISGEEIHSLVRLATFWDKMDTKQPLCVSNTDGAAEAR